MKYESLIPKSNLKENTEKLPFNIEIANKVADKEKLWSDGDMFSDDTRKIALCFSFLTMLAYAGCTQEKPKTTPVPEAEKITQTSEPATKNVFKKEGFTKEQWKNITSAPLEKMDKFGNPVDKKQNSDH